MVMRKDRNGMAVLLDAMLFLMVLMVLGAFVILPSGSSVSDDTPRIVGSFHSVMLKGDVPGGDGSSVSYMSLSSYIVLLQNDITSAGLERIGKAVNGTLVELDSMGYDAWWILYIDGSAHTFGHASAQNDIPIYADDRILTENGNVRCTLFMTI